MSSILKKKIRLFGFPYAGGSSAIFAKWKPYLDGGIELVPVELAGRGRRIHEAPYRNVDEAIEDVFQKIKADLFKAPYALYGHSMGAMIAYELACKIRHEGLPAPVHLFFSGRGAPHVNRKDKVKYHLLADSDFKEEIIQLGGTPPEFFEYPELVEVLLPLLKNDFKLAESDPSEGPIVPFEEGITVFAGKEEDLTAEECDGWKWYSSRKCTVHYFNGGHFFLNEEIGQIIKVINQAICQSQDL
jgi:surfactin synthase thioesterase subunit